LKRYSNFNSGISITIGLEVVVIGSGSIEYIDCYNIK